MRRPGLIALIALLATVACHHSVRADPPMQGIASFYGESLQGQKTASGERFDMNALTAAHRTLPFGSKVLVTNLDNGKQVTVRINDRGPYAKGRIIDVSRAAARVLEMIKRGFAHVRLEVISTP